MLPDKLTIVFPVALAIVHKCHVFASDRFVFFANFVHISLALKLKLSSWLNAFASYKKLTMFLTRVAYTNSLQQIQNRHAHIYIYIYIDYYSLVHPIGINIFPIGYWLRAIE